MASASDINRALDREIAMAHQRFVRAMETRLPRIAVDSKERYFAVLSLLVSKLEDPRKNLRDILNELVVEAAGHLMTELSS